MHRPHGTDGPVSSRDRALILGSVLLALFLAALDQTIVSTALPRIVEDLQGVNRYAWVASAYLLASTALVPVYGKLADTYPRKYVELGAVLLFLTGSVLCGISGELGDLPILGDGMSQLILFRAIQGAGGAGLVAMTFIVIADLFTPAGGHAWQDKLQLTGFEKQVASIDGGEQLKVFEDLEARAAVARRDQEGAGGDAHPGVAREPCIQRDPVLAIGLDRRQRCAQFAAHVVAEGRAEFQRQIFRQHRQPRAPPRRLFQQPALAVGERGEIARRADGVFHCRDLHSGVPRIGRVQNVSACSTSPAPISSHASRIVIPGWRA